MSDYVAVVGSRNWTDARPIRVLIGSLPLTTIVVSGGAPGVDEIAAHAAESRGMARVIFHAGWTARGKAAGPHRNAEIANYLADRKSHGHAVQCFAYPEGGPGTADMIRRCKEAGIPVEVRS